MNRKLKGATLHFHLLAICVSIGPSVHGQTALSPSPVWKAMMPTGPAAGMKITEAYAGLVARDTYFWAWPMVNIYNRRNTFEKVPEIILAGPLPSSPLNRLGMLTNYIPPDERVVACPNQDVVYGGASLALDKSPVVVQVPDFGDRFWVYQAVDLRTDEFSSLGTMYGTKAGFYLLVGPDWQGAIPKGITKIFRAKTNTGFIIARVFQDDTPEDKKAIQSILSQITIYPLSDFDGKIKINDWFKLKQVEALSTGEEEQQWVVPEKFFDVLPMAFADAPPLPGEEARYAQVLAVLEAAANDPKLKEVMTKAASEADAELIKPLLEFRNYGLQLPHHWSTISNGAAFGTDYFTRTAVARSNIFVNKEEETKYYYQDLDQTGQRLHGSNRYTVVFPKDATPPVKGFWSLTLYNQHHFFAPNDIARYSVGTKNKSLKYNEDGSLTIYVQAESPGKDKETNWLPAPKDGDFSLYVRAYWPRAEIVDGTWTPPPVEQAK